MIRSWIAESRMELDQVRLLVLQAAQVNHSGGPKLAKKEVSCCILTVTYKLHFYKIFHCMVLFTDSNDQGGRS